MLKGARKLYDSVLNTSFRTDATTSIRECAIARKTAPNIVVSKMLEVLEAVIASRFPLGGKIAQNKTQRIDPVCLSCDKDKCCQTIKVELGNSISILQLIFNFLSVERVVNKEVQKLRTFEETKKRFLHTQENGKETDAER